MTRPSCVKSGALNDHSNPLKSCKSVEEWFVFLTLETDNEQPLFRKDGDSNQFRAVKLIKVNRNVCLNRIINFELIK